MACGKALSGTPCPGVPGSGWMLQHLKVENFRRLLGEQPCLCGRGNTENVQ